MSQNTNINSFHALYVAPLVVAILSSVIMLLFNLSPTTPSPERQREGEPVIPNVTGKRIPIDGTTLRMLREFQANEVAALKKYEGKEIQVQGTIASIDDRSVELYGDIKQGEVEGIYIRCLFQEPGTGLKTIKRNHLITMKGKVDGYVHHARSPYVILSACCLVHP